MFERRVTISFGQCDPAGIVYYPNYFDMFNTSTEALICEALGVHIQDLALRFDIFGIPMIEARNVYHRPSRPGDNIVIKSQITRIGRSSFDVYHQLFGATGDLAVEGFEKRVWAVIDPENPKALKGKSVPKELRAQLD